jgi:hypothetical protein
MKRFIRSKKGIALVTLAVAAVAAVGAWAYFTGSGTGTGSAQTATAASLNITQIGAGYDSLIPNDGYHQDQCFQCAQISELGNQIQLANSGSQRLTSAVVAFRNWGAELTTTPITLSIAGGGPSSTVTPDIAAAQSNGRPTVTNVKFPFNNFVDQQFVYDISFDSSGAAGGLNVALSSHPNNTSVGSNPSPGTIYMNIAGSPGASGDFPTCTNGGTTGSFTQWVTNCGDPASGNPGAYGTNAEVAAGNADIPAVEFNVVGGIAPGLYPGGPSQPVDFAITNPGSSGVYVNHVLIQVTGTSNSPACDPTWYSVSPGSPGVSVNATISPGTSFYSPSGASISMTETNTNQDACQGRTVNLGFTASGS